MCVCCRPVVERSFARIGGVRVPGSVLRLGFSRKTGSSLRTSDSSNKSKSPRGVDGKSFESTWWWTSHIQELHHADRTILSLIPEIQMKTHSQRNCGGDQRPQTHVALAGLFLSQLGRKEAITGKVHLRFRFHESSRRSNPIETCSNQSEKTSSLLVAIVTHASPLTSLAPNLWCSFALHRCWRWEDFRRKTSSLVEEAQSKE